MIDLQNIDSVPYEAASTAKVSFSLKKGVRLLIDALLSFMKVLVLSCPLLIKLIKELFIGRTKKQIRGWTVLITGGAHGIGKAISVEFSKEGCNVVIIDIDGSGAQLAAEELREKYGVKAVAYKVDVTDHNRLIQLREEIERDVGPVDILVNNAGLMPLLSLREGTIEDVDKIVSVNITSHFYTTRIFLEGMLDRKYGHVVTMSSITALHAIPRACLYTASKYAITGFTRALEQEIRQDGFDNIKFTTVHPYFVATRKDLMDSVNLRIPPITAKEVAKSTVKGVLTNARIVVVPSYLGVLVNVGKLFPFEIQNLIRDHVLREKEAAKIKNPADYIASKKYSSNLMQI